MSATRVAREILGMMIIVGVLLALSLLHERAASTKFREFLKTENASDSRIEDALDMLLNKESTNSVCCVEIGEASE